MQTATAEQRVSRLGACAQALSLEPGYGSTSSSTAGRADNADSDREIDKRMSAKITLDCFGPKFHGLRAVVDVVRGRHGQRISASIRFDRF